MVRKELTAANIAASRKKRKEDEARFESRKSTKEKESDARERRRGVKPSKKQGFIPESDPRFKAAAAKARADPKFTGLDPKLEAEAKKKRLAEINAKAALEGKKKIVTNVGSSPKITLTQDQVDRIEVGTLKATPETLSAIRDGTVNIQDPGIAREAGRDALAAITLLPVGRGVGALIPNLGKTGIKAGVGAGVGTGFALKLAGGSKTRIAFNTKTQKLATATLKKAGMGQKALLYAGAWASAIFLGMWGQAEAPEPLAIVIGSTLIPNAEHTGDWSVVREAEEARAELLDLNVWEKAALWSPVSPAIGITNKINGAISAAIVQSKVINDLEAQSIAGTTENDDYER